MGRERARKQLLTCCSTALRSRETTLATKNLETYIWLAASLPYGRATCTECYAGLDAVIGAVWAVNGRQTASHLLLNSAPLARSHLSPSQRAVTVVTRTLFPLILSHLATKNLETYFWHAASLPLG